MLHIREQRQGGLVPVLDHRRRVVGVAAAWWRGASAVGADAES